MTWRSAGQRSRTWAGAAVVLLAVGGLAACSSDDDSDTSTTTAPGGGGSSGATTTAGGGEASGDPFVVAVINDVSGSLANLSKPAAEGLLTVFDKLNDEGGIDGHPIDYSVYDAQSSAAGAQTAAQQALASDPDVIVHATLTSEFAANVPVLQASNVPVVIAGNGLPELSDPANTAKWVFSTSAHQPQVGVAYIDGLQSVLERDDLDGVRIGTESLDSAGSNAVIAYASTVAEDRGADIVAGEKVPTQGFTSFTSQASNIVGANPDAVLTSDQATDMAIIVPALRTAGFDGPIIGGEGSADAALLESLDDPNYYAAISYRTAALSPEMTDAAEQYGHSPDGTQFGTGWVAGYVVNDVLSACGFGCSFDDFVSTAEGLGQIDVPGDAAFTPPSFAPDKHFAVTSQHLVQWDSASGNVALFGDPLDVSDTSKLPPT